MHRKYIQPAQVPPSYITIPEVNPVLITPTHREVTPSCHRERYLKHGAGVSVVSADRPSMQVDDLLRQGKADAGFPAFAHVKAVEDVRQVRFGNAVPVVLYAYRHLPPVRAAGQAQLASAQPGYRRA